MNKFTIWEKYYIHSIVITSILFFFYLFWINNSFLYSSILDYKNIKSDLFDWTVYPIEFVPNPIELSYNERKKSYSEINSKYFIKTPIYNPDIFSRDLDSLTPWSKDYSDTIIQRLVFTVPYMGTYNFDFKEFSGSHPWVDIIAPEWTPVRNIAAWVVVDVWYQWGWFWNYVLVKHNNVPLPTWWYSDVYSVYAHMLKANALVWTKIRKWEVIWYVGQTWTATVPHLHFQIDLQTAPYSPYWPFSTADMKNAKVWFFDWVNIWLWRENVIKYTINPLKFVNENLSSSTIALKDNSNVIEEKKQQEVTTENQSSLNNDDIKTESWVIDKQDESSLKDNIEPSWTESKVELVKEASDTVKDEVSSTNEEIKLNEDLKLENNIQLLKKEDILNTEVELLSTVNANLVLSNSLDVPLTSENKLSLNTDDLSDSFEKVDNINDLSVSDESLLTPSTQDKETINLLDDTKSQTWVWLSGTTLETQSWTQDIIFSDIKSNYKYFNELKYFKEKKVISWFTDGTFRPNNNITRFEGLKIILLANWVAPIKNEESKFLDIDTNSWENTYINSAVNLKIVSLDNNKFYPFRSLSRVEALKLILTLAWINIDTKESNLNIKDVDKSDWYYKYVNYAIKNNLLEIEGEKFYPNKPLKREELVSILYKIIKK